MAENYIVQDLTLDQTVQIPSLSDIFDKAYTNLSDISEKEGLDKLVTAQAVSSFVQTISSSIMAQVDAKINAIPKTTPLIGSDGCFYMPDGKDGDTQLYRLVQTYIEKDTGSDIPLVQTSDKRYVRNEAGEFIEKQ